MRALASCLLALLLVGCGAAFARDVNTAISGVLPIEQCVLAQVEAGNDNAGQIAISCGGIAVTSVISIVETILSNTSSSDAGTTVAAKAERYREFLAKARP